jgi:energy-coupling factor transporter ATP-binding protein EcfA2
LESVNWLEVRARAWRGYRVHVGVIGVFRLVLDGMCLGLSGVEEVVSRLSSFRVPGFNFRFVDREREARAILDVSGGVVMGGWITVIYGPKGCGKTELFRALYNVSREAGGVDFVIVRSEREAWRVDELLASRGLRGALSRVAGSLGFEVLSSGEVRGFVDVAKFVGALAGYIAYRLRRGRRVVIVVDEVRGDSDVRLAEFRGWLEGFANTLREHSSRYEGRGGSIAVVVLTSDAMVREIRNRVGSKVAWALLWNLPYEAMVDLAGQLELGEDPRLLWRLTGGNPRALVDIKFRGLKRWIEDEVLRPVRDVVEEVRGVLGEKLWDEIGVAVEDIDEADYRLKLSMLRHNIAIYVAGATHLTELPREGWVRERYAYQMPAYQHALKLAHERRDVRLKAESVLESLS